MIAPVTWETVSEVRPVEQDEVHLWWQDLHTEWLDSRSLEDLLSEREAVRVKRFRVDTVKREFMAARGVLKLLLSGYLGHPVDKLEFRYGPLGKPSIPPGPDGNRLCFNYTDSGGYALYAFARNRELGVDLERLSRQVRSRRIIERRFAPRESAALLGMPAEEQRRMFLACWTRKEGYGKALGLGIHFPFDCRELCVDCRSSPLSVDDHVNGESWDIHQLYPADEFVAALVHPSGTMRRRYFRLKDIL